jgi:FkbM family methyltransferase
LSIEIDLPFAPKLRLDFGAATNRHFAETGTKPDLEPLETCVFLSLLSDRPQVLDLGANIGWFTALAAASAQGRGEVVAFEPEAANFAALANNVFGNRLFNVRLARYGVGDADGEAALYLCPENPGDHRTQPVEGREAAPIQIVRLDSFFADSPFVPDLVKIDIQGAELAALRGGARLFARAGTGCAKLIEFWPGGMRGGVEEADALIETLFAFGQPVWVFHHEGEGSLRPVTAEVLGQAVRGCIHPSQPAYLNLLLAPLDDRFHRLKGRTGPDWRPWS